MYLDYIYGFSDSVCVKMVTTLNVTGVSKTVTNLNVVEVFKQLRNDTTPCMRNVDIVISERSVVVTRNSSSYATTRHHKKCCYFD